MVILTALQAIAQPVNFASYSMAIAPPNQSPRPLKVGRFSSSFKIVGKVGGVLFENVALPANGFNFDALTLDYNPQEKDGNRLKVNSNNRSYHLDIPDWQLAPIAQFSDSEYFGCVSLFGDSTTANHYDIAYHEAFYNTLLGLRLLQYDILLMDPLQLHKKPSIENYVPLGYGESTHTDSVIVEDAYWHLRKTMYPYKYMSWVVTDYQEPVRFYIENNKFSISGNPWFYFWISDSTAIEHQAQIFERQVDVLIQEEFGYNGKARDFINSTSVNPVQDEPKKPLKHIIDVFRDEKDEIVKAHAILQKQTPLPIEKIRALELKYTSLENFIEKITDMHEKVEPEVYGLSCLNDAMKQEQKSLEALAPDTYHAIVNTMRYAAFFRYVKQKNPEAWKKFLAKLPTKTSIRPISPSPYLWQKPDKMQH